MNVPVFADRTVMTFRDYLRILRRRWVSFTLTAAAIFSVLFGATRIEPPFYSARTRVMIEAPEPIQLAEKAPTRLLPHPITVSTWIDLITDRKVLHRVEKGTYEDDKNRRIKPYLSEDVKKRAAGWLGRVRTETREGTYLVSIVAEGPDRESAAAIANAFALAASHISSEEANLHVREAKEHAASIVREKEKAISDLMNQRTDVNRKQNIPHEIPVERDRLSSEYSQTLSRIQEIDRTMKSNEHRIRQIREDQTRLTALNSASLPRADRESEALLQENAKVANMQSEILRLRRELFAARTRYFPVHPTIVQLQESIRNAEAELASVGVDTVQGELDREEISLQRRNRLLSDEKGVLELYRNKVNEENEKLLQPYLLYQRLTDEIHRETKIRDEVALIKGRMDSIKGYRGYVSWKEEDRAEAGIAQETQPQSRQTIWLALLISLLSGLGIAYLREQMDTKIRTDYDVKRHLNLSVLSAIPKLRTDELLLLDSARQTILSEEFDKLVTMLPTLAGDRPMRTLTIVSPNPEEGKTTISINTAIAAARQGKRVLLVDADMRMPSVHRMLQLQNDVGFSSLLRGNLAEEEADRIYQYVNIEHLSIITSGPSPESPYALLEPKHLRPLFEQFQQHFDLIVIDTPPLLRTGDAIKIASATDGSLMVLGAYETDHRQAIWAKHLLENVSARTLGVVLNKASQMGEKYYYYYYSGSSRYPKSTRT